MGASDNDLYLVSDKLIVADGWWLVLFVFCVILDDGHAVIDHINIVRFVGGRLWGVGIALALMLSLCGVVLCCIVLCCIVFSDRAFRCVGCDGHDYMIDWLLVGWLMVIVQGSKLHRSN